MVTIIPIKTTRPFTPIKPTMPIPLNQKKAATHFAKCCSFRSRCKRGGSVAYTAVLS